MHDPDHAGRIAQQLVERAIAAGATAADAMCVGDRSLGVEVRLGEIEGISRSENQEVGLRIFDGQRSATIASSDLSDESFSNLVDRCLAMAREAPEDRFAGLAPEELLERRPPLCLDSADEIEPDPAALRSRALEAEQAALGVAGVTNSGGASASVSAAVIALATSAGFAGAYRSTGHGCSAAVIAGTESSSLQRDSDWHSARHFEDLDPPAEIGHRAGERAAARLNPSRPRPGRYPILFDPRVSASLIGHFAGAISGSAVARKTSFLQDRLGERLFRPGVTIVDDPLRPRGLRSRPFDGEGVRVSRQELVSDGILNQWIADSASARQLGIAPTGQAGRGVGGAPHPSLSNFYLAPGERSRADLLASFPEAVLVVELIGQGVNPVTGDYSRGAVGFMVRDGAIAEPVAEITVAANLIDMFAMMEPASDLVFRRGSDAPTVLIPEMTVGAA
ncbi:MAG: TldD/PmbA family protein [Sphingomicrobium sp.]